MPTKPTRKISSSPPASCRVTTSSKGKLWPIRLVEYTIKKIMSCHNLAGAAAYGPTIVSTRLTNSQCLS